MEGASSRERGAPCVPRYALCRTDGDRMSYILEISVVEFRRRVPGLPLRAPPPYVHGCTNYLNYVTGDTLIIVHMYSDTRFKVQGSPTHQRHDGYLRMGYMDGRRHSWQTRTALHAALCSLYSIDCVMYVWMVYILVLYCDYCTVEQCMRRADREAHDMQINTVCRLL